MIGRSDMPCFQCMGFHINAVSITPLLQQFNMTLKMLYFYSQQKHIVQVSSWICPVLCFTQDATGPVFKGTQEIGLELSSLNYAACSGNLALTMALLGNLDSSEAAQALSIAGFFNQFHLVAWLLSNGCRVDSHDTFNALHSAAYRGHLDNMEDLVVNHNLDPNIEDLSGATPIFFALGGKPEVVAAQNIEKLIKLGANPNRKVMGRSYAEYAQAMGMNNLAEYLALVAENTASET
jgi:ankyrin repeat protein